MPKPSSALREFTRVGSSKVEKRSSSSSGCEALASGSVPPASSSLLLSPGVSWMYFRPSAERGLTLTAVSFASGSTVLSSFSSTTARARPSITVGVIFSTTPTRKPPTRTSLPSTSLAPFGSTAFTS